jgi:hypothetical protein
MATMPNVPIDWTNVNWLYVAVLAVFVFFSSLIGMLVSFKRALLGAFFSALLFAAAFVFWTYYPHNVPLPTGVVSQKAPPVPSAPTTPAAPSATPRPPNPITPDSPSPNAQ